MSTAKNKTGHGAAWANLVICGGLSWGVNFWHATHATSGATSTGVHVGTWLALLCATGPVVSAGFASHNISRSGAGKFKQTLTYLVFAMGMALSITAQAEAVAGVFGNIYLGVTFALMLDLSAFMSLHSIMSASPVSAPVEAPVAPPVQAPVSPPVAPPAGAPVPPPVVPPVTPPVPPPVDRPKRTRQAAGSKTSKAKKLTPDEARAKAWELLKKNPDMSAPALAMELGKSPTSGHVRDMKAKLLKELHDAGELPSVRSIGA